MTQPDQTALPGRRLPVGVMIAGLALATLICDWLIEIIHTLSGILVVFIQLYAIQTSYRLGNHYTLGQRIAVQTTPIITLLLSAMARYTWDTGHLPAFIYIAAALGIGLAIIALAWVVNTYLETRRPR